MGVTSLVVVTSSILLLLLTRCHCSLQVPQLPLNQKLAESSDDVGSMTLSATPDKASNPILEGFPLIRDRIRLFPNFAGNTSNPNTFWYNLLSNIGDIPDVPPCIRVGGNTQDYALYNGSLAEATNGTYTTASADYPTILPIVA